MARISEDVIASITFEVPSACYDGKTLKTDLKRDSFADDADGKKAFAAYRAARVLDRAAHIRVPLSAMDRLNRAQERYAARAKELAAVVRGGESAVEKFLAEKATKKAAKRKKAPKK